MKTKTTIVIAEDSQVQAERLQYLLEQNTYTVYSCSDGKEALEVIKEIKPDLIITDIMMPVMDGYQLTKFVKGDAGLCKIPVIVLTMFSNLSDILRGLECGADNYIIKPFDEDDLISKIENVLNAHSVGMNEPKGVNLEITYDNYLYTIDSESTRLANFLITTSEVVSQKSESIEDTQNELKMLNESLEEKVKERTKELQCEIIDHKRTEEELRKSEERYKGIVQSTVDCIAVYKPLNDGEDFVFVDINPMVEKIEKISKEEVIGKRVSEVFPGVNEFGLMDVFQQVWKTGKSKSHPISIYEDERIKGYRENYVYKLSTGEIVALYRDLTIQKAMEEELIKHRDNLEETVKERTKELEEQNKKLDDAMKVFVGREKKIGELERKLRALGGKV